MTLPQDESMVNVVVPFHNTAKDLRGRIESVLAQSYGNFELILQDNASDDGSTAIALEFAGRDPRIRYFRLASLVPQVPNYNLPLERIRPDSAYCKIVQADDWIHPECIRCLVAYQREGLQTQGLRIEPLKFALGMIRVLAEDVTCPVRGSAWRE